MKRRALILAAHGVDDGSEANELVESYADRLAATTRFDVVSAAFHYGTPKFRRVLDLAAADEFLVLPFMATQGYFSRVVLPRELARNACCSHGALTMIEPVGAHHQLVSLVAQRVELCLMQHDLKADEITLAIVGHGTPRHGGSRSATERLVSMIERADICAEVLCAFLDETPDVESILSRATCSNVIVIPHLMTPGLHTRKDIPRRLGIEVVSKAQPRYTRRWGRGLIMCEDAIGTEPGMFDLLHHLAADAYLAADQSLKQGTMLCG